MDGNNVKKDDENGQLSCGKYSSPAAARLSLQGWVKGFTRLSLQRLGRRSLPLPNYLLVHVQMISAFKPTCHTIRTVASSECICF